MLILNYFYIFERMHLFLVEIILFYRRQINISTGFVAIELWSLTFSQLISFGFPPLQHFFGHYFLLKGLKPHCMCDVFIFYLLLPKKPHRFLPYIISNVTFCYLKCSTPVKEWLSDSLVWDTAIRYQVWTWRTNA